MWVKYARFGFHGFDVRERAVHRGMCRVRLVAKGVEKEHVEALKQRQGTLRNLAVVGKVRGFPETVSEAVAVAVLERHRDELETEECECALPFRQCGTILGIDDCVAPVSKT